MNRNAILGIVLLGIGLSTVIVTAQIPVRTFAGDPGPHVFPYFSAAALILCGIILGVKSILPKSEDEPLSESRLTRSEQLRVAGMLGLLVALALSLWLFGFYVAVPLGTFAIYWAIADKEARSIPRGAVYALATFATIYVVFVEILNSYMPSGIFF